MCEGIEWARVFEFWLGVGGTVAIVGGLILVGAYFANRYF